MWSTIPVAAAARTTGESVVSCGVRDAIVSSGQASISYLQRRLRIGFSRAARLVDMMEAEGLVSSGQGGKARELLVPKDYFDEVDQAQPEA